MKITNILIELTGQRYRVWHQGTVLLEGSRCPAYDAARALLGMGIIGRCEMRRRGKAFADAHFDIEKVAKLTVRENDDRGPEVVRWKSFLMATCQPGTAENEAVATLVAA